MNKTTQKKEEEEDRLINGREAAVGDKKNERGFFFFCSSMTNESVGTMFTVMYCESAKLLQAKRRKMNEE